MLVRNAETKIEHYISTFEMTRFLNEEMLNALQLFHFPAYSPVYIEAEEQRFLYFLVEGQVQCHHYHLNGTLAVFALTSPFAAIGDLEILDEEPVNSHVVATKPTTMLGIARPVVHQYGKDDTRFLRFLVDQLREKLYKKDSLYKHQILPLIHRLAVYLLAQPPVDGGMILPDKEVLASLLGTTTRHLNRVLKELVERECINAGYPLVRIRNRSALERLAS